MLQPLDRAAHVVAAIGLEQASAGRLDDPRPLPDAALVAHIVERHHAYVRRALPYVVPLLARVAGFHGKRDGRLWALADAGEELADALEASLDAEEQVLFPALLAGAFDVARREALRMSGHHRDVRLLLGLIRSLADGFAAPAWADGGHRALLEELEALEDDLLEHMHLEGFVLVPRLVAAPARAA